MREIENHRWNIKEAITTARKVHQWTLKLVSGSLGRAYLHNPKICSKKYLVIFKGKW